MVASHEVVPNAGGCVSQLQLDVTGVMAILLGPLVRRGAQKAMATENACLRERFQALV